MADPRHHCPHCGSHDVHQDSHAHGNRCYNCRRDTKTPVVTAGSIRLAEPQLPDGAVTCYLLDGKVYVPGDPHRYQDHNCDAMGCGQEHIVEILEVARK